MEYQKYIDLGFKRFEINCSVTFRQTGYNEYGLSKKINKRMTIEVVGSDLFKPKLYIKKRNAEQYHIINITPEMVVDIFEKKKENNDFYAFAC
jgi:hypothetical protein